MNQTSGMSLGRRFVLRRDRPGHGERAQDSHCSGDRDVRDLVGS